MFFVSFHCFKGIDGIITLKTSVVLFEVCIINFVLLQNEQQEILQILLKRQNIFVESRLMLFEQFLLHLYLSEFPFWSNPEKAFSHLYQGLHQTLFGKIKTFLKISRIRSMIDHDNIGYSVLW